MDARGRHFGCQCEPVAVVFWGSMGWPLGLHFGAGPSTGPSVLTVAV